METDKEKLKVIISLEYRWYILYDEYKNYYSISVLDDFSNVYEDSLHNLYISYFGEELGVLLNNYMSDDIWKYIPFSALSDIISNCSFKI